MDNADFNWKTLSEKSPEKGILYHYTNTEALLKIAKSKKLWATQIGYLNDQKEFFYAVDLAEDELRRLKDEAQGEKATLFEMLIKQVQNSGRFSRMNYLASLSEKGDLLSQWRAYCPEGGYSIGFDYDRLKALAQSQTFKLLPCVYEEEKQKALLREIIDIALENFLARDPAEEIQTRAWHTGFFVMFIQRASVLKNPSFSEEKEWRLIRDISNTNFQESWGGVNSFPGANWRAKGPFLIPYQEFCFEEENSKTPIKEVYVGPSIQQKYAFLSAQAYFSPAPEVQKKEDRVRCVVKKSSSSFQSR